MGAYPEPKDPVVRVDSEGAIVQADADGMKPPDSLEVKRRVRRVGLQQFEILVCELANAGGKCIVAPPKAR